MNWRQVGSGRVQLRLPVAFVDGDAYLCAAYVKKDARVDKRNMATFSVHAELIRQGRFTERGRLR